MPENALEHGKTYNQLSSAAIILFNYELTFKEREKTMKETVDHGRQAIKSLSTCEDPSELAKAYARTVVCLNVYGYYFKDIDERERYCQEARDYWLKAKELSEEIALIESLYPVFGGQVLFGLEGTEETLKNYEKALEYARKTKDKFFIGCALDWLTYHTVWKAFAIEDTDQIRQLAKKVVQYIEGAKRTFSQISFTSPRDDLAWIEAFPVDTDMWDASLETDMRKRR